MKLHFFTVRDIEDYRKYYQHSKDAHDLLKKTKARTVEEFDQEFLCYYIRRLLGMPGGIFESRIWGDTGFPGLRLDFNFGLRLDIPEGNFRVKVSDFDSGQIFFDKYISGGRLLSVDQYFVRWHVEVFLNEEKIFTHTLNLEGQPVAISLISGVLGDTIAFLPYLREFQKVHRCNLSVCPNDSSRELIAKLYPDIKLIEEIDFKTYATYYPLMIFSGLPFTPADYRNVSMLRVGGVLLGINYLPPKAEFKPTEPPVTDEPYVCIGVQSSVNRKCWLYPGGWDIVVDYLKSLGYRVFCIDKSAKQKNDGFTICKPDGAEDFTGNRPLLERANMLYHADFFIGLGSGLSWLADAVNCPVVMICGFSQDWFEFYTPYRVANRKVCNGCFNDIRTSFTIIFCPYHKDTPRELECQKKISPRMVINAIERLIVDKNLTPPALKNLQGAFS
ncbi:MAG: autotransporter strand-loop-strand O-heptosyltransferase [Selenomonadaceae bacterium]|nr:autotransporter strand-loop-strand O-heptosyltransferase [Selenomonadaceae bacterium]